MFHSYLEVKPSFAYLQRKARNNYNYSITDLYSQYN